eukprot:356939-Chlamydomonas_euryale.AAC.5
MPASPRALWTPLCTIGCTVRICSPHSWAPAAPRSLTSALVKNPRAGQQPPGRLLSPPAPPLPRGPHPGRNYHFPSATPRSERRLGDPERGRGRAPSPQPQLAPRTDA